MKKKLFHTFFFAAIISLAFPGCKTNSPQACFNASSTTDTINQVVSFSSSCTSGGNTFEWNFGDGGSSTSPNPTHVYTSAGVYSVSLWVTNKSGSSPAPSVNIIVTNWKTLKSGTLYNLNSVCFPTRDTGFAVGAYGAIVRTVNAGASWTTNTTGPVIALNSVFFVNPNTGYAVGGSGTIIETTDGGNNWKVLLSPTSNALNSVYFISPTTGFAVGVNGSLITTTNSGSSWSPVVSGVSATLSCIYFSGNNGFIGGANGTLLQSTNSGNSWTPVSTATANGLNSVFFTSPTTGYIAARWLPY